MFKGRLHRNAQAFLDPGETIHESARVVSGMQNHALIATDRHLYALRLSWPGLANPVEVLQRIPLEEARVELETKRISLVDRQTGREIQSWARGRKFDLTNEEILMAEGEKLAPGHEKLADYVNGAGGGSGRS